MKTPRNKKTLKAIAKWLSKPGNTKSKLAAHLGYLSSSTVDQWFKRNNLPAHQERRILDFITGKTE